MSSSCFKNVRNGYRLSLRLGSVFGALMVSVAQAAGPGGGPDWFDPNTGRGFRKNIPDFYQHQYLYDNARQNWEVGKNETGGGWCRPTALANCLFSFKVTGYNGLLHNSPDINDPNKWLENACKAIEDLEKVTIAGYQKYLDDRGHGEKACPGPGGGLKFTQYVINPTTGKIYYKSSDGSWKEKAGPAFDLYKKELLDGQDVLIRFAPGTNNAGASGRWWGNFHYVTGAGVDCGNAPGAKPKIYFADPDSNKGNDKANSGWNFKWKDAGVNGRKYDPNDPVPVPSRGTNPTDDPVDFSKFYACMEVQANGTDIGGGADNRYLGTRLRAIETICPLKGAPKITLQDIGNAIKKIYDFFSSLYNFIDGILVYPTGRATVQPFSAMFPDPEFSDPSGNFWTKEYISPGQPDPDGNIRSGGGVFFHTTGALPPGCIAQGVITTDIDYETYDLMVRLAGSGTWDDATWFVQPVGNEEILDNLQMPISVTARVNVRQVLQDAFERGAPVIYTLTLTVEPNSNDPVIITFNTDSQVSPLPDLYIDAENWDYPQIVEVHPIDDGVPEGIHSSLISHTAIGSGYDSALIDDVLLTISDTPFCGQAGTVYLRSDYDRSCTVDVGDVAFMGHHFLSCAELDLSSIECFTLHDFSDLNREFGLCTDPANPSCIAACGNGVCESESGETCKTCLYDCGACSETCGDGIAVGLEECDGSDLRGASCVQQSFNGGVLNCDSSCTTDSSACYSCSDLQINGGESDIDCGGPHCPGCPGGASCNVNEDCDSLSCNGGVCEFTSSCGNGFCDPFSEDEFICDLDCFCGDGLCNPELEDPGVCPEDCSVVPCGNGVCDPLLGEDEFSCLQDCFCGDGLCNLNDEDGSSCFSDCFCGDGFCDFNNEDNVSCPEDCAAVPF